MVCLSILTYFTLLEPKRTCLLSTTDYCVLTRMFYMKFSTLQTLQPLSPYNLVVPGTKAEAANHTYPGTWHSTCQPPKQAHKLGNCPAYPGKPLGLSLRDRKREFMPLCSVQCCTSSSICQLYLHKTRIWICKLFLAAKPSDRLEKPNFNIHRWFLIQILHTKSGISDTCQVQISDYLTPLAGKGQMQQLRACHRLSAPFLSAVSQGQEQSSC